MVRKNPDTVIKARIRRYIRRAIEWNKVDEGDAHSYDLPPAKYKYAKRIEGDSVGLSLPYYSKSTLAIEEIAEKIFNLMRKKE